MINLLKLDIATSRTSLKEAARKSMSFEQAVFFIDKSKIAQSLAKLDAQNAGAKTFNDAELSKKAISMATSASGGRDFEMLLTT